MKVGFHLPQWGRGATREGVVAVARTIEAVGLDSLWVADHVALPPDLGSAYPYGEPPFGAQDGFLDAFTALAVAAGATERVTLATSVLVLPMRETLQTAKTVATLDVLSNGRVCLAVGAGWCAPEFEALGVPFAGRGRRLDEQLAALRRLWSDGQTAFAGEHVRFDEVVCRPTPVQAGGPPLLIGGMGTAALRRAAALGDGWHALGSHAETLTAGRDELARLAEAAGRDPAALTLSTSAVLPDDEATAIRRLTRLREIGVDHVVFDVRAPDADAVRATIERFVERVLPHVLPERRREEEIHVS